MLQWTGSGAVEEPTVLQVRVGARFQGKVAAGAPQPKRPMTVDEVIANIRHFAVERVGPRTPACTRVVLSGVSEPSSLVEAVAAAREWGVEHVTWHAGLGVPEPALVQALDAAVVQLQPGDSEAWRAWSGIGIPVTAVVLLTEDGLDGEDAWIASLVAQPPERLVLTWPFPGGGRLPADVAACVPRIHAAVRALEAEGISVGIKGLPPCVLANAAVPGRWADRVWRTRNRWYVDSDHQRENALLFLPDVLRFAKPEACRFCRLGGVCDGVAESWLLQGRVPGIRAFR